jgi:predicted DNA-binding ribbon-helix-helix protein
MPGSSIARRSIAFNGKKTSVSLEDEFWNALKEIAGKRAIHLSDPVSEIDERRGHGNLSSALRLFVLDHDKSRHRTPSDGLGPHSWPPQFVARRAKIPWRRRSLGFRLSVVEIWHPGCPAERPNSATEPLGRAASAALLLSVKEKAAARNSLRGAAEVFHGNRDQQR